MYEDGDNKRKAEIRNPSMLADVSFGSVQKSIMITEPSPDHKELQCSFQIRHRNIPFTKKKSRK